MHTIAYLHLEQDGADGKDEEQDADRPTFSLITGTYRQAKRFGPSSSDTAAPLADGENPAAVVLRNQDSALSVLADSAASK